MTVIGYGYGGEAGVCHSQFVVNTPPIRPPKIFSKNTTMITNLLKKTAETFNKETVSKVSSQPAVEPAPIDNSPRALAKAAAEAAGFELGKEYEGRTTKHRPANKRLLWCSLHNWGEPVLYSVNNSEDWQPAEKIWGFYAGPDAQGRLQFENRDGIRRNRWKAK